MCSSRLSAHCQKCFWAREEDEEEDRLRHAATTCEVAESEFFWGVERSRLQLVHGSLSRREGGEANSRERS